MKKCLLVVAASLALSGVAMAAPVTNIEKGETNAGYIYWNPNVEYNSLDLGSANANGFFVETALSDKVIVGVETIKGKKSATDSGITSSMDARFTDVTLQYKLSDQLRLIAGNRNYDTGASVTGLGSDNESTNKFITGLSASTALGEKMTGYASVLTNSIGTDWQVGVNRNLTDTVDFNVNYRYYDGDTATLKGIGAGLVCKF